MNGIQEVSGSIPLISTKNNDSHNQMCESLFYTKLKNEGEHPIQRLVQMMHELFLFLHRFTISTDLEVCDEKQISD